MRAVRFHEFGGPDVLRVDEVDDPTPGAGQVVLQVGACALNHVDCDIRAGTSRFPFELPFTPGLEVVGTVAELGSGVEGWNVGDRVMPYFLNTCGACRYCRSGRETLCDTMRENWRTAFITGGCAEALVCHSSQLLRAPEQLTDPEVAAFQIVFGTAWHALFTRANLRVGETIMINSVGSGVGSAALQLAKAAGAFVIGNASGDAKLERAGEFGLDEGINYMKSDLVAEVMRITDGRGVDVVLEYVGGDLFQMGLDSLAKDGRLVTCGAHAGEVVPFDIIPFFRTQKSVIASSVYTKAEVDCILELLARGQIRPIVHAVFPLEEATAAMEAMENREHFGKIVVEP